MAKAYMTMVPVVDLNFVYVQDTRALDQILSQSKLFFDQESLHFTVVIPENLCVPEVEDALEKMGSTQTGKAVAMAISLSAKTSVDPYECIDNNVVIRVDNSLKDWIIPLIDAFKSTAELTSLYAKTHITALEHDLNLEHFCLYKKKRPISAGTLSIHDNIARIDDVSTLLDFQRKGYATYLMRYVLAEAKKLGATSCFLESSVAGFPLYQKLGFKSLFRNNIYSF
jgi:GNAT superfamily N-acetyltransferase